MEQIRKGKIKITGHVKKTTCKK